MKKLKVYIAGKVSPNSVFGRHDWRDEFCKVLSELSGTELINLDPTKYDDGFDLDENNDKLIFGRDCFMIKSADLVIVNLTDDISVGGSQEMLIAKYYKKPLIGIAPRGGKFYRDEKEIRGKIYKNYINPFVSIPCDVVVEDVNGAATFIKDPLLKTDISVKDIKVLDEAVQYYKDFHHNNDKFLHNL
jgi:hypothetical protein